MIRALLPHRFALRLLALIAGLLALAGAPLQAKPAPSQGVLAPQGAFGPPGGGTGPTHIHATLLAEGPVAPGGTVMLAVLMQPAAGWHGYWSNPGDAGLALTLEWKLPGGAKTGALRFPVPQTLLISGLMNHVYEHDYAVLVPLTVPPGATPGSTLAISADANWLACTLQICVPERSALNATVAIGAAGATDPRFNTWRAALPAPLDRPAQFSLTPTVLRIAIPFPRGAKVEAPHVFVASEGVVDTPHRRRLRGRTMCSSPKFHAPGPRPQPRRKPSAWCCRSAAARAGSNCLRSPARCPPAVRPSGPKVPRPKAVSGSPYCSQWSAG